MSGRFQNPWQHDEHSVFDILRWKLGWLAREPAIIPDAPDKPAEWQRLEPELLARPPSLGWRVVWLGHASFLLQGAGRTILIDPVFAKHCGPFPLPGLFRHVPPPCSLKDLPAIDAVLLTHTHYDHLDLATLRELGSETPILISEGHSAWLKGKGFSSVEEVPWHYEFCGIPGLRVTATPAMHFTARSLMDRNRGHWCGWLIEGAGCKLWHAGDTAWCPAFRELGSTHGPIDFGMIPIGAYQPRSIMRGIHMNPAEAVAAFQETRCRRAIGMHWGVFRLTDEAMGEAPLYLRKAMTEAGLDAERFDTQPIGRPIEVMPVT